jgi:hypothetical protein
MHTMTVKGLKLFSLSMYQNILQKKLTLKMNDLNREEGSTLLKFSDNQ